jgi:hypothetical protein
MRIGAVAGIMCPMEKSQARLAENESIFRDANEFIDAKAADLDHSREHVFLFLCECSRGDCVDRVPLTRAEYDDLRSDPARFVLVPGHERPSLERVVRVEDEYEVVEKTGGAAQIAVATAPRR